MIVLSYGYVGCPRSLGTPAAEFKNSVQMQLSVLFRHPYKGRDGRAGIARLRSRAAQGSRTCHHLNIRASV